MQGLQSSTLKSRLQQQARLHFEENVAYLKVDNQTLETQVLQELLLCWSCV